MEQWRDVVGYEGWYQVSDLGKVRSVDRVVRGARGEPKTLTGKVLKPAANSASDHLGVALCKEGNQRTVCIHQLVMAAWIGPRPKGLEVLHGPNGVEDNSVGNLSYGTHSQKLF